MQGGQEESHLSSVWGLSRNWCALCAFTDKQSWVEIGIPIKERDDILRVMSKVQDKFRKVKKNVAKMKEETRQSHLQELSGDR